MDAIGDHERLAEAMANLSAEQRQVLELTFFRGLSSSEVAVEIDVPTGTVKSRLRAGLMGLKAVLAPGGVQ